MWSKFYRSSQSLTLSGLTVYLHRVIDVLLFWSSNTQALTQSLLREQTLFFEKKNKKVERERDCSTRHYTPTHTRNHLPNPHHPTRLPESLSPTLSLSLSRTLSSSQFLPMRIERIPHRLYSFQKKERKKKVRTVCQVSEEIQYSTLTLWLCRSKQNAILLPKISLTSGPYPLFCPAHSIHPFSCTILPSITPSRIALPVMYSASSSESRCSLWQMSRREIRE